MRGGMGGGVSAMRQAIGPGRLGDDEEILAKPFDNRVIMRLIRYGGPFKKLAAIAAVTMLVYTAALVAAPWLVAIGIAQIQDGDGGALDRTAIIFISVALVGWGAQYIHLRAMARVTQGVLYILRIDLFRHLQRLSMRFYDRNEIGRVMSRVQNDVLNLQEFLSTAILGIADLLALVGILAAMFLMDPRLAAATLSVVPVLFIGIAIWQSRARLAFIRVRQAIALVNAHLQESISGVRVVQSLNRQDRNFSDFDNLNDRHLQRNLEAGRLSALILPKVETLMATALTVVVIFGGNLVLGGDLEIPVLVAFALYIQRFFDPIRNLTMQYTEMQRAMASGVRIFEVLDTKPDIVDAPDAVELTEVKGEITFVRVNHHYTSDVQVLHDVNLRVRPGETVALVGQTGAGKTTITSLIARLYDVSGGTILIDGHDVRGVTASSLRDQMSMVLQDPFLFSMSVRDNIRYGRPEATVEEIERAARVVGAHDFILALEHGYDTVLQERGGNLSVGQRQLVSYARAIVRDPAILILDEATANIDTQTEVLIQNALGKLLKGRTSVVIAHRLSTIRNADQIVVLERGRVVESGPHEALMALGGVYHQLYTMNYQLESNGGAARVD